MPLDERHSRTVTGTLHSSSGFDPDETFSRRAGFIAGNKSVSSRRRRALVDSPHLADSND